MDKTKKNIAENWLPEDRNINLNVREEIQDHLRRVKVNKELQFSPDLEINLERGI